jgi:hypothetical protein
VKPDLVYPPHTNAYELANSFVTFFTEKIATIHRDPVQLSHNDADCYQDTPISSCCLEYFDEVAISDLLPIVRPLAKKSWISILSLPVL